MSILILPSNFVRRNLALSAALVLFAGASVSVMNGQTSQASSEIAEQRIAASAQAQGLNQEVGAIGEVRSSSSTSSSLSSNPSEDTVAANVEPFNFANAMQYNGRPRYGRPRYRGGNTNPDGSSKWIFYGGAGLAQPAGNTWKYFTPSWGLQIGGGRQLNAHFAVPAEFDYDRFGLTKQAMANQSYIYTLDPNAADNGIDANGHTWSFSIDPRYTIVNPTGEGFGAYVLADVGFYHKVTNFTAPQEAEYYDPYYGPQFVEVQGIFDHYTSNAPGFGGGIGATYKFSHFSNERFYAEARYVFIDNSQRQGLTAAYLAAQLALNANYIYPGNNAFPANSNRTTYIPVKFGLQF